MKTFLTLCTFAMVSAGIYGFVDMTNDVRHGTMIEYDRGEKTMERPVTVERLKMAQGNKIESYSKSLAKVDLKGKILDAKPEVAVAKPSLSISDFVGENYSRSAPVELVDENYSGSSLITDLTVDTAKTTPGVQPVTENPDNTPVVPVSLAATTQPIYAVTAIADTIKQAETIAPTPIYEYYGRGNPKRVKKIVVKENSAADTTKTVVKKDDL